MNFTVIVGIILLLVTIILTAGCIHLLTDLSEEQKISELLIEAHEKSGIDAITIYEEI